jgi:hypothetical protein
VDSGLKIDTPIVDIFADTTVRHANRLPVVVDEPKPRRIPQRDSRRAGITPLEAHEGRVVARHGTERHGPA